MSIIGALVVASFTAPEKIGANPQSMLWLLPLVAAIVVVYKATKLPEIKIGNFLKEVAILFGSIVVFMIITGLVLCVLARLITE
jgi:ABC-type Co2+ transport system permease subunit